MCEFFGLLHYLFFAWKFHESFRGSVHRFHGTMASMEAFAKASMEDTEASMGKILEASIASMEASVKVSMDESLHGRY